MKKSVVSLITLLLVTIICLSSCDVSEIANSFDVYQVTVTGSKNYLGEPLLPYYRAGDTVEIKVPKICDAEIYVYVNNEKLSGIEYDRDYNLFEFEMPNEDVTVHLTFDPFYGRENYTFDELLYWIKYLGDDVYTINSVALVIDNFSDETSFIERRYSEKQEDIEKIKAITEQPLIKVDDSEVGDTAGFMTYNLYRNADPFMGEQFAEMNFEDNFFSHFYNMTSFPQPFRFEDPDFVLPTIDDPDYLTYSFRREPRNIYVKKYDDDSFSERYDHMTYVEFVPYEGEELNIEPRFYFDTKCGRVNLLNEKVFELNGKYYEIVSGESSWAYNKLYLEWE